MGINRSISAGINQKEASLFFWTGMFMYVGKAVDTSIHDHHVVQILISLEDAIEIKTTGSTFKEYKTAVIASDQPHECRTHGNTFLLLNIAPETRIGIALKRKYLQSLKIAELPAESTLEFIEMLKVGLKERHDNQEFFSIIQQFLHALCCLKETKVFDERILMVLELLNQKTDIPIKINELANKVFISPNRLIHLFTDQVGIPIRKYILWRKLLIALQEIVTTKNITQAALEGGFSDAPHFNRTFKRMFGLSPTTLLKNSQIVQAYGK